MLGSLAAAGAAAACGSPTTVYSTALAPDFKPGSHTLSVLGVYKDGRMSSEAWDGLAGRVAQATHASAKCECGFREGAAAADQPVMAAIDDYTLANGPTDDLLGQLAPAAQGDLILVVTVAGRLPKPDKIRVQDEGTGQQTTAMGGRGGGMGGMGGMRGGGGRMRRSESSAPVDRLELYALLFSVAKGQSVARVGVEYTGTSIDEAMSQFVARLAQTLPGAACAGWDWHAKVDLARIRESASSG
jgi:hypothetical protein